MKAEINANDVQIPYGVLHDQIVNSIKLVDNKIVFTFEIELYENDYTAEVYSKYKDFKNCEMTVELYSNEDNYADLYTTLDKHNKFNGIEISLAEFCELYEKANYISFLNCLSNGYGWIIQFYSCFYDAKGKYKKYKEISTIDVFLLANKITWNWY